MVKHTNLGGFIGRHALTSLMVAMLAAFAAPQVSAASAALAASAAVKTGAQRPSAPAGVADGAHIRMRWELVRNEFSAQSPDGSTHARLVLTNLDQQPLPPQGWALYFNIMDGVTPGPLDGNLLMEQVAGSLFRIRPTAGFAGVAPGQTLDIPYRHPELVIKLGKAPIGPYLVYDSAPDVGLAITDYAQLPLVRPEQTDKGSSGAKPVVTAQDTYRRNLKADLLPASAVPPVFPTPLQLQPGAGTLRINAAPVVSASAVLKGEAEFARTLFASALPALPASAGAAAVTAAGPALRLSVGAVPGQSSPEAYSLNIGADGISIVGNSAAGVSYGLQSLRDLLPLPGAGAGTGVGDAGIELPALSIVDAPRFGYRGFLFDVSRNFHDKQTVFRMLDLMARYKLNTLHFHLTDDEGWRLEIAGLPELTSIGSVRGHSAKPGVRLQPAYGSGPDADNIHGSGHYSRADYIEILRYAAARHIDVIPEIEMPGHARAAVQAMEARYHRLKAAGKADAAKYLLNDFDDRSVYKSPQLFNDHVINPGLESSFTFIDHVIGQVAAMHREAGVKLKTIHVGGDELPRGAWEKSPASLAVMKREKLEDVADLWDYFYDRVDVILRKHGLFASGWEELAARVTTLNGKHKLIPNPRFTRNGFTAYVWNNTLGAEDLAYRLANAGYDLVLAPVTKMYMDMAFNPNPDEPGVNWGDYIELDTVYDFIPLDYMKNAEPPLVGKDSLTDYGKRRIKGIQATLFTETVQTKQRIDYMVMPRLLAVAERAWAADPAWATEQDAAKASVLHRKAWSGFVNALGQRVLPRLDLEQAGVDYRIAPPGLMREGARVLVNHVLPGTTLRYTSDGSEPSANSKAVTGPIADKGAIQVAAFDRNGRRGVVARIDNP